MLLLGLHTTTYTDFAALQPSPDPMVTLTEDIWCVSTVVILLSTDVSSQVF